MTLRTDARAYMLDVDLGIDCASDKTDEAFHQEHNMFPPHHQYQTQRMRENKEIERKLAEADRVLSECKRLSLDPVEVLDRACQKEQEHVRAVRP